MAWHYHVYSSCSFFSCVLYVWNLYSKNRCMYLYKVLQMSYFPDCFHFGHCDANTFKPTMPCPIPVQASLVCVVSTSFPPPPPFFIFLFFWYSQACGLCCLNFLFPQELGKKFIDSGESLSVWSPVFWWFYIHLCSDRKQRPQHNLTSALFPQMFSSSLLLLLWIYLVFSINFWMISVAPALSGFDKWTNIKGQERWMEILPQHPHPPPPPPCNVFYKISLGIGRHVNPSNNGHDHTHTRLSTCEVSLATTLTLPGVTWVWNVL